MLGCAFFVYAYVPYKEGFCTMSGTLPPNGQHDCSRHMASLLRCDIIRASGQCPAFVEDANVEIVPLRKEQEVE